jgi:hypothetical protein
MRNLLTHVVGVAVVAVPSLALAATANYGDKFAADLVYRQVTEDSITDSLPLFGNPIVSGNALVFSPTNFGATTTGGGIDITDSTLSTTLEANPGKSISNILFNEAGDYSLAGVGTAATTATVTATYFLRILDVNGIALNAPVSQNGSLNLIPSGGTFDLPNDGGTGIIWTGSANIDVNAILAANAVQGVATKAILTLDNQLIAVSETGTVSFIKKKTTDGVVIIVLPEPTMLGLIGGAAVTMLRRRR